MHYLSSPGTATASNNNMDVASTLHVQQSSNAAVNGMQRPPNSDFGNDKTSHVAAVRKRRKVNNNIWGKGNEASCHEVSPGRVLQFAATGESVEKPLGLLV